MRSMTGIGKGSAMIPGTNSKIDVEIKSNNHRFLEVSVKCPNSVTPYENQIKKKILKTLTRGYVLVSVQMEEKTSSYRIEIDKKLLDRIVELRDKIVTKYQIEDTLSFDTIIKLPGIVKFVRGSIGGRKVYRGLNKALSKAFEKLIQSKRKEGRNIGKSIKKSVNKIKSLIRQIEKRAPLRRKKKRTRLEKQLAESMTKVTPKKMAEEILYYVDRLDITEECARIRSHLSLFEDSINDPTPGRRLNFLTQELYREANTIAAKAYDAKISEPIVCIKEEIEKVREQVQNVE